MKDIAIFGAGGLGRETAATLDNLTYENPDGWRLLGFFDDTMPVGTQVQDYGKVLGGIKELNRWNDPINVVICLGYPKNRYKIRTLVSNPLVSFPNLIHKDFHIGDSNSFTIGYGNLIQWGCRVTTDTVIGNFNFLNGEVGLGHDDTIGNYNVFMNGSRVSGYVSIGDCNLFGTMAYVMEKLHVGSQVTVGPLSALLTKPSDGCTYIGNPAKKLRF